MHPPRLCKLLGIALAIAPFLLVSVQGCGQTAVISCPGVYDPDRIGPDGEPDPCCDRSSPCPPPGAGKDAGSADAAAADADGGPPSGDAGSDAADDADATADADAAADADAGSPPCAGACLELPPAGWFGPMLLWRGGVGETVACPAAAPVVAYTGFADLLDPGPASCGACACGPSIGTCEPPEHLTANTALCAVGGGVSTPFDPPPGWDGTCTSFDHIGPGSKSLTSGPLTLNGACVADAGAPNAPTTPAAFGTSVVACVGTTSNCDAGHVCAATAPNFQSCIYQQADVPACPGSYPIRIAVADGFDDQRECTSCTCGAVEGSSCTATLTVYTDSACGALVFSSVIDSLAAPCFPVTGAVALGSKTLTKPDYKPGTCMPSGGEPTGSVVPTGVATFCCLP